MISIFGDFCQISAKKWRFSQKSNVMINFFQKLAIVKAKLFAPIFFG
jgi:hypothetical protein